MIGGRKKRAVTLEAILGKVSESEIYRHYVGHDFKFNKAFNNPWRSDKNPSFSISSVGSKLHHIDWGDERWRGGVVDLVKQIYNVNFNEALLAIDRDMQLGLFGGVDNHKNVVKSFNTPKLGENFEINYQFTPRDFNREELKYWEDYHIGLNDIESLWDTDVEIHAVKSLYKNKQLMPLPDGLIFVYLFNGETIKIYRPHADKKDKWRTNTAITQMYGLDNIQKGTKNSLILKSVKDYIVCKTHIIDSCCGTQNESPQAIPEININYLLYNCENNYIIFDLDSTGVASSQYFNKFGLKYWNIPKHYYEETKTKDPADFVKNYSPKLLREEISKKIQL